MREAMNVIAETRDSQRLREFLITGRDSKLDNSRSVACSQRVFSG